MGENGVLEGLKVALGRLEATKEGKGMWDFRDWNHCACGHIYTATVGLSSRDIDTVTESENPVYQAALSAVVRAAGRQLGFADQNPEPGLLPYAVSDLTSREALEADMVSVDAAIALVREAISLVEAEQEQARLAVLAAAEEVVAQVDTDASPQVDELATAVSA